jgi:hypothetical protein
MFGITVNAVNDPPTAVAYNPGVNAVQANMKLAGQLTLPLASATDPDTGDGGGYTATLTTPQSGISATSPAGGTVTITNAATGAFDLDPPAGATGNVTFTYQVCDTGNPGPGTCSATATATINVASPVIWFVNSALGVNGTGTLSSPFNTLAAADAVDLANQGIFLYSSATSYTGALALNTSEKLIGQATTGTTFDAVFGITPPTGTIARPSLASGTVTMTGTVTLAGSNKLRGLALATTTTTGLTNAAGPLTGEDVDQVSVTTTTGTALNLNNASGTYLFSSVTTNGAANGILLDTLGTSTVTVSGGTIVNAATRGVDINSGTGSYAFANTITTTAAGRSVEVTNHTAGTVAFNGAITDSGLGINLGTNTGGTINFTGGVNLSTGANDAFTATGGGTVNVCDESPCNPAATGALVNTLATTTGTALNVGNTTIGSNKLEFKSISAGTGASGPASGIILNNTGNSGGLTVKGDGNSSVGGNSSGGVIQHTTQYGISLASTNSPSFTNMNIHDISRNGIDGTIGIVNFTLANNTITNTGTAAAGQYEDNGVAIVDHASPFDANTISGTVSITGNSISQPRRIGIALETWSGTISNLIISSNTVSGGTTTSNISHGIEVLTTGVASTNANLTTATIQSNTISGFRFFDVPNNFYIGGTGIFVAGGNTGNTNSETFGALATPILIDKNSISNVGDSFIKFTFNGRAGQSYTNITNNGAASSPTGTTMTNAEGVGLSVFMGGGADAGHPFTGKAVVDANRMSLNNRAGSSGLGVQMDNGSNVADIPSVKFAVTNNVISNEAGSGIAAIGINNNGSMDVRIQDNSVTTAPVAANSYGIRVSENSAGPSICTKILGNTSFGSGGAPGIGLRRNTGTPFSVDGMAATSSPGVEQYVGGLNPNSQLASGIFQAGDGNYYRAYLISQTTGFTNCTSTA